MGLVGRVALHRAAARDRRRASARKAVGTITRMRRAWLVAVLAAGCVLSAGPDASALDEDREQPSTADCRWPLTSLAELQKRLHQLPKLPEAEKYRAMDQIRAALRAWSFREVCGIDHGAYRDRG